MSRYRCWDALAATLFAAGLALHIRFGWWEKPFAVQRRIAEGNSVRLEDHITAGLWWAGLVTLGCGCILAATRPLWTAPRQRPRSHDPHPLSRSAWIAILLTAVVATAVRLPRMDLSLYADELYPMRKAISGEWTRNTTGETKFKPVKWERAFFENREANNHVLQSVASRALLYVWRSITGAERHEFAEVPLRLPSLLAGVASIALVGIFCARAFGLSAAIVAMILCAFHPWHIRYSTEARGYALAFLGATLALCAVQSALRRDAWPAWAGFGVGLFIMLTSFPGAIYLAIALNATLVVWMLVRWDLIGIARLTVVNAIAACAFLWLYGPSIQQIAQYMGAPRARSEGVQPQWLLDEAALFLTGMPWVPETANVPTLLGVSTVSSLEIPAVLGFVMLAAMFGLGVMRAISKGGVDGWLLVALPVAAILAVVHCHFSSKLLFPWYLIFALPGVLALIALGATVLKWRWLLPSGVVAGFLLTVLPQLGVVLAHAREPNREVARALLPRNGEGEVAGGFWTQAFNYEPRMRQIVTADDVAGLIRQARAAGWTLRVGFGHRDRAVVTIPDALAITESPELFEKEAVMHGIENHQFTHTIYRLRADVDETVLQRELESALRLKPR